MTKRIVALFCLLVTFLVVAAWAQTSGNKVVKSDDDLTRFTYPVRGSASASIEADDATLNVVAAKIVCLGPEAYAEAIDLIRRGATTSEDGRRRLIDEKQSVAC